MGRHPAEVRTGRAREYESGDGIAVVIKPKNECNVNRAFVGSERCHNEQGDHRCTPEIMIYNRVKIDSL
jgi:hypothetical protein